jgi:OmpA family
VTFWDLDADTRSPGIGGQVHVVLLDDEFDELVEDDVYVKHYRLETDSVAPAITCPQPIVVECTGNGGIDRADAQLEEMAKLLKQAPARKLLVVGHTDNVGSFTFNMDLSQRRAAAVVAALATRFGIGKDRLAPVGVSFASPVAPNADEGGRAKNRRVELVDNPSVSR